MISPDFSFLEYMQAKGIPEQLCTDVNAGISLKKLKESLTKTHLKILI
jgi:hypothetical protein